ncbi:type II secretion system F family protein [Bdellovibrionota bacterium FG-2]
MPEFQYQGVDKNGKKIEGKLSASSEGELRMALRGQGIRPTRVSASGVMNTDLSAFFKRQDSVPTEVLVTFTRQLQVLISSGVPIVQGLDILVEQTTNSTMKRLIATTKERVSGGAYLWETLAGFPNAFPKLYVSLIRAGEASGSLDMMLKRLCRYLEDADRLKKMIRGALFYPAVVVSVGLLVVFIMLVFIIPKFEALLKSANQELPLPTQIVINVSHFLGNYFMFIVGGASAIGFLGFRYFRSREGRAFMDRTLYNAPLFGTMMKKAGTARFSRTMQTLLSSGVNLIDAIDICKATVDNAVLEDAIAKIRSDVESGKTLGSVLTRLKVFPTMAIQMITVGESTGNLDKMLEKVADFYEEDVEALVGGLTKMIEPLILVLLGGTVGGLLIAMYLPVFQMAGGAG